MSHKQSPAVRLGLSARHSPSGDVRLARKAGAVAQGLLVPDGVEFARFEHEGRAYALSARVVVEVERLDSRTPDLVIRTADIRSAAARSIGRSRR